MTQIPTSVLYVGNFPATTGYRPYCVDLADRLEARGWRVARTSNRAGRVQRLVDMMRTAWVERRRYAVAHVDLYSGPAFAWAEIVCFELRRLGKPYVLTLHGGNLPEFAKRWPKRTRRLLSTAARVTAPSSYLQQTMQPYRDGIAIVRNAIEVKRYSFALRSPARPRLLWLRALHETYNPVLAVEVLARVRAVHPDATLTMIGPDKHDGSRERVEQRAAELGVTDQLNLVGGVDPMTIPQHLTQADVLINTTNVDNTPVSVLEAMAAGLCVVSTSVGGLPYLLRDHETAMLVPPRDAAAMATAVIEVLATPSLAATLSRQARAFVESCDWTHVLDRWDEVLRGATAGA